jgi:outer membrane protein OmpA-like peptidoglycan-associated protein
MKPSLLFLLLSLSSQSVFAQTNVQKDSISVSFAYNQSEIVNAEQVLTRLSKIDASLISVIKLVGYTDSTGSLKRNKALAADRIRSVGFLLKSPSFSHVKVETINANELSGYRTVPDELNRRVDLLIYGKKNAPAPAITFELNKPVNLNINFKGGTADILPISYPNLEKLRDLMLGDTTLLVKLHGHVCCDNDMQLSVKRAIAVMQYLIHSDIDEKRISAEGFSNSLELFPDDSEEHMSMNRRVEAIFYRKE